MLYDFIQCGRWERDFVKYFRSRTQNFSQEERDWLWDRAKAAYAFGKEHRNDYAAIEAADFYGDSVDFSKFYQEEERLLDKLYTTE